MVADHHFAVLVNLCRAKAVASFRSDGNVLLVRVRNDIFGGNKAFGVHIAFILEVEQGEVAENKKSSCPALFVARRVSANADFFGGDM